MCGTGENGCSRENGLIDCCQRQPTIKTNKKKKPVTWHINCKITLFTESYSPTCNLDCFGLSPGLNVIAGSFWVVLLNMNIFVKVSCAVPSHKAHYGMVLLAR